MPKSRNTPILLTPMHAGQQHIARNRTKRTVVRAGRRYGKTTMFETWASQWSLEGKRVGIFAPDYKKLTDVYSSILRTLKPGIENSNKTDMTIDLKVKQFDARMKTLPGIDFWTLNDETAGRGRAYHEVIIDEAQHAPNLKDIFEKSIVPTLADFNGNATMGGTPLGVDEDNYFYSCCSNKEKSENWPRVWTEFHAPSRDNPTLPLEVVASFKTDNAPKVYEQEFEALFVSWTGESLLGINSLTLDAGGGERKGVPFPKVCDYVFAVVDTAVKDGKAHDGTAVTYFAKSSEIGYPLVILDWELIQIKGNLLPTWLPNVFKRCEYFSKLCHARARVMVWIEDKASGSMLLQHAQAQGWPAEGIPHDITSLGKDARVIGASGHVWCERVKVSEMAFDRKSEFKGVTRNHLLHQVCGYTINDKHAATRADDLTDCAVYGILISLGGPSGF